MNLYQIETKYHEDNVYWIEHNDENIGEDYKKGKGDIVEIQVFLLCC